MISSSSTVCDSKNSRFIEEQEGSGTIGSLANTLSKINLVVPILF